MAVTIKDIAAAVGVSRGTVDRVINHRGGVSEEVAARGRAGCGGDGLFSQPGGQDFGRQKKSP